MSANTGASVLIPDSSSPVRCLVSPCIFSKVFPRNKQKITEGTVRGDEQRFATLKTLDPIQRPGNIDERNRLKSF
ncbi:hypothetical protein V6N13_077226 [Hibiscus sabdariffa]